MHILKVDCNVNKELRHLCAGKGVAVVGFHVAANGLGQRAPNFDVMYVVFVELL